MNASVKANGGTVLMDGLAHSGPAVSGRVFEPTQQTVKIDQAAINSAMASG